MNPSLFGKCAPPKAFRGDGIVNSWRRDIFDNTHKIAAWLTVSFDDYERHWRLEACLSA